MVYNHARKREQAYTKAAQLAYLKHFEHPIPEHITPAEAWKLKIQELGGMGSEAGERLAITRDELTYHFGWNILYLPHFESEFPAWHDTGLFELSPPEVYDLLSGFDIQDAQDAAYLAELVERALTQPKTWPTDFQMAKEYERNLHLAAEWLRNREEELSSTAVHTAQLQWNGPITEVIELGYALVAADKLSIVLPNGGKPSQTKILNLFAELLGTELKNPPSHYLQIIKKRKEDNFAPLLDTLKEQLHGVIFRD